MDFYRKRHMGLLLKHLAWIASCVVLLSCSSDEDDDFGDVGEKTRITVLMSLGGQGDNGYNDLITEGIMKVSNHQDVELSMIHPCDMDETRKKNLPQGVMGFLIQRYGASYLAGCIASPHREAVV